VHLWNSHFQSMGDNRLLCLAAGGLAFLGCPLTEVGQTSRVGRPLMIISTRRGDMGSSPRIEDATCGQAGLGHAQGSDH
jgi:hypothetical protein